MLIVFMPFIVAVVILAIGIHVPSRRLGGLIELPQHPLAPVVAAFVTAAVVLFVWGGLDAVTPVHDEASYLLQARTFASFHWAMPSPPLPEFFEQYHAFVTPTYASKYSPGHGLLLVPGIWLSMPGLMPLLLSAMTGGLLFLLVRRVSNGWVAVLTLLLWLPTTANLRFRSSYMSETTTSALWLLGWWAILEWRRARSNRWLVVLAACVAWMAITRPLTAVAYALPLGIVVLADVTKRRGWRELARPLRVALAILALLPIYNWRTMGDWRTAPYETYTKEYLPWDHPGFGLTTSPPERALPPDMQIFSKQFMPIHAAHTPERLPSIFVNRWNAIITDALHGWRTSLVLLTLLGFTVLGIEGWFAVGSALLLTLAYLAYAHPSLWTVYYLEIFPVIPFLTAMGIWALASMIASRKPRVGPSIGRTWGSAPALGAAFLAIVLLWPASFEVRGGRKLQTLIQSYHEDFRVRMSAVSDKRAIVFVRYAQWHNVHTSLIANDPNLQGAPLWVVYDRGTEDERLAALAPDRETFLYDESTRSLTPLKMTIARR